MPSAIPLPALRQVLVVEDDPYFQRAIGEAVVRLGTPWLVHGCGTGAAALAFWTVFIPSSV